MGLDSYIGQYGRRIYGLCRHLCADPDEADDLYQETWLRALQHFDRYDKNRPFEPWLAKVCVNAYRSSLRRLRRGPPLLRGRGAEPEALLQALPTPERPDYGPLYEAIGRLPERLRLTLVLFYFRDMQVASCAQVLGVPEGTVKSRLNKARKLLKEALGHEADL